jgi:hypothetical protein
MSQVNVYKEKNDEILGYIKEFNKVEDELTAKLEMARSPEERKSLENSIALIQTTRVNLSNALGSLNYYYSSNLEQSSETLNQQTEAVAIIDREMQLAKQRLAYINKQKANKMRAVEINQYYDKAYQERTSLVKWIIMSIIVFVAYVYIRKVFVIIPPIIYNMLGIALIAFFGYNLLMVILSINARNTMVYDEYTWSFSKDNLPDFDKEASSYDPLKAQGLRTCIGQVCCSDGTQWDSSKGICVPNLEVYTESTKCSPAPV